MKGRKKSTTIDSYKTTNYKPMQNNIYRLVTPKGKKYRVRMSINNVKYDEWFNKRKDAVEYFIDLRRTKRLLQIAA
jgi:hypothetical protein